MPSRYRAATRGEQSRAGGRADGRVRCPSSTGPWAGWPSGAGARWLRLAAALLGLGCAPSDEIPVVARGRYVELATDRDDRVCGGTIHLLDDLVEQAFEFIGERAPDRIFVRYEWVDEPDQPTSLIGHGVTRPSGDGILIRTDQLIHEHEVGHAAPTLAWPNTARFLREGLAVLLDGRRMYFPEFWPKSKSIDDVIDGDFSGGNNYFESWFLVSQIVRDHGVDGLKALWFQVPSGASAAEVRTEYETLFGRSMDVLLEPTEFDAETMTSGPRTPCMFSLCPGPILALDGGSGFAPGPTGCEDDPNAVGPHSRARTFDGPPVWRETYVQASDVGMVQHSTEFAVAAMPCFLDCRQWGTARAMFPPENEEWDRLSLVRVGPWRIEVRQQLEALSPDAGGLTIVDGP